MNDNLENIEGCINVLNEHTKDYIESVDRISRALTSLWNVVATERIESENYAYTLDKHRKAWELTKREEIHIEETKKNMQVFSDKASVKLRVD